MSLNQLAEASTCSPPLTFDTASVVISISCLIGILWAFINFRLVKKVDVGLGVGGEDGTVISMTS